MDFIHLHPPKVYQLPWHNRLGYPHLKVLNSVLHSLHLPTCTKPLCLCEYCLYGKMHKLPFSQSQTISMYPLQLVHSDVWGPAPELSINGYKYYVSFIDDFSKYTWLFPIARKSDVLTVFQRFKSLAENLLSSWIQTLRTDGGGEYVNHNFTSFLQSNDIFHQKSCAYSPKQNGVAERKHRHITEMAICLLTRASLPSYFWSFAFSTAAFLINRLSSSNLQHLSLF